MTTTKRDDPVLESVPFLKRLPRLVRMLPFVGFCIAFWMVSATEKPWVPLTFNSADKVMHLVAYAGLTTWARVLTTGIARPGLWAFALGGGYGIVDEIHQSFVPGRSASVLDVAADMSGAAIAVFVIGWMAAQWVARAEKPKPGA